MFKPFFVHSHHKPGHRPNRAPRGFTAYIEPTQDNRTVVMRVALCSPKDQFSKKEGRSQALISKHEIINKRRVPHMLSCLEHVCELNYIIDEQKFYYVFKHMM